MRSLEITCRSCGFASTLNVSEWQDDVLLNKTGTSDDDPTLADERQHD
jgi:hypothetical protein